MIGPFSGIGEGVSAVVRRIGRAFLFVGQVVKNALHFIGGAVHKAVGADRG